MARHTSYGLPLFVHTGPGGTPGAALACCPARLHSVPGFAESATETGGIRCTCVSESALGDWGMHIQDPLVPVFRSQWMLVDVHRCIPTPELQAATITAFSLSDLTVPSKCAPSPHVLRLQAVSLRCPNRSA